MLDWLIHTENGSFAQNTWTAIGTIGLCVVFGLIIFVAWRLTFSRVIRLMTGPGYRAARLIIAGGIYVPLITWWIHRIVAIGADFKQWAAFLVLLIFLNYVPVNITGRILDQAASMKQKRKQKRLEEKANLLMELVKKTSKNRGSEQL